MVSEGGKGLYSNASGNFLQWSSLENGSLALVKWSLGVAGGK